MKSLLTQLFILVLTFTLSTNNSSSGKENSESICPICTMEGMIICPDGFEAVCMDKIPGETKPQCLLLGRTYKPGCWKFEGIKKLDLGFLFLPLSDKSMIQIVGGGETYTLNSDIIFCKKL